jgi:hypothetical protein
MRCSLNVLFYRFALLNAVLANVIEKNFPQQHKQREEEEKQAQLKMCLQDQLKAGNNDFNVGM